MTRVLLDSNSQEKVIHVRKYKNLHEVNKFMLLQSWKEAIELVQVNWYGSLNLFKDTFDISPLEIKELSKVIDEFFE